MIQQSQRSEMDRKVFVSNLPSKTSDIDLLEIFRPFGSIVKAYLVRNRTDGYCKNFGFVVFQNIEDVQGLLEVTQPIKYKGRRICLKQAVDRLSIRKPSPITESKNSFNSLYSQNQESSAKQMITRLASCLNESMDNYRLNPSLSKQTNTVTTVNQFSRQSFMLHTITPTSLTSAEIFGNKIGANSIKHLPKTDCNLHIAVDI